MNSWSRLKIAINLYYQYIEGSTELKFPVLDHVHFLSVFRHNRTAVLYYQLTLIFFSTLLLVQKINSGSRQTVDMHTINSMAY